MSDDLMAEPTFGTTLASAPQTEIDPAAAPVLSGSTLDRVTAEDFLVHEAALMDQQQFHDWHALFTEDASYLAPMGGDDPRHHAFFINDDALRLEERVYHTASVPFPSQLPRSDTLHQVSNVRVVDGPEPLTWRVYSVQVIHELRTGDFRQVGLGDLRNFPARVIHDLVVIDGALRIKCKTVTLMNRRTPMSNLTFLL